MRIPWRLAYRFIQAYVYTFKIHHILEQTGFKGARARILTPWKRNTRDWRPESMAIREISWAVEMACRWRIRKTDCLPRALVAYHVLRKIGACPQFIIATRSRPFASHAWVELDGVAIADYEMRAVRSQYVPLLRIP